MTKPERRRLKSTQGRQKVVLGSDRDDLDQEKKIKVLEAAKELFGRFGFKKTTVDEIADRAGISKRTMYEVFKSKERILADLLLFEGRSFRRFCLHELHQIADPVERFRAFCRLSSQYFAENPFVGQVAADDERLYTPFLGNELHQIEDGMAHLLTELVQEGIDEGALRVQNVDETVQCIMVLYRHFTYHSGDRHYGNETWIDFILRAIGQGPSSSG